jgi:ParB family transcriptional regulator, chromosome partitioning protein
MTTATNPLFPDLAMPAALTSDDRYTPRHLIEAARVALGGAIDLDPASCAEANAVVQARHYFTIADNGLAQPWRGRVWLNPPYSDPLPWLQALVRHAQGGQVDAALALLPCAGSPRWARLAWAQAAGVCLLSQRVQFWPRRRDDESNDRDSAVFYFGPDAARFRRAFEPLGVCR